MKELADLVQSNLNELWIELLLQDPDVWVDYDCETQIFWKPMIDLF